mmetsp:Transcript_95/g.249  ORF Transcript_95/g.249 Transcript_95/m.249 type:complete len:436 (-) Transcript_95:807-2114(-)
MGRRRRRAKPPHAFVSRSDPGRRRWRQNGEKLRQFGHILGHFPSVLACGPDIAVAAKLSGAGHAAQLRLGKGAGGFAVFGHVPDMFHRGRRWRCCGACGRLCAPRAGIARRLTQLQTHGGPKPRLHGVPGTAAFASQGFGGLELHVFAQISDHTHRRPFVHHRLDRRGQRDIFDVQLRDAEAVFGNLRADFLGHKLAQLAGVSGHVENGDARFGKAARHFLHDDVADLEADLVHGEFAIGANDFHEEAGRIDHAHRIGAEGAQAHRAKFRIAADDRVLGAPFQVVEPRGVDEIDLGFERAFEAVIPVLERRHDRHVVGLKHIETGGKDVSQLALVDEHRCLPLADRELGPIFDLVALALKAPDHSITAVVHPVDNVDEFAGEEVENTHFGSPYSQSVWALWCPICVRMGAAPSGWAVTPQRGQCQLVHGAACLGQ